MKVLVFGCELAGLVTAGALAQAGNHVLAVPLGDIESDKLSALELPRSEPGLRQLLEVQLAENRLQFVDDWHDQFQDTQVVFFSMPSWQLSLADKVLQEIVTLAHGPLLIINQSSFAVGTADHFCNMIESQSVDGQQLEIKVAVVPEFISEGSAINDFTRPDRIIVGTEDAEVFTIVTNLMRPFNRVKDQIIKMSTRSAEFTKFAVNAFLATRISLINELANSAEKIGVDIEEVRNGIGSDSRIGFNYLYPGCGFGGPSFAADVKTLVAMLRTEGQEPDLLETALAINEAQKEILFRKAWRYYKGNLSGRCFAIWGLSFKPNTATIENAPSLKILEALWSQGAITRVYDPKAMQAIKNHFGDHAQMVLCDDPYSAAENADAIMIVTEWKNFWSPDLPRLKQLMRTAVIFDGRNILEPASVTAQGFEYFGIGR